MAGKSDAREPSDDARPSELEEVARALAELFPGDNRESRRYRRYQLEHIDGDLVFRQTEFDAAFDDAMAAVIDDADPSTLGRRIIKLK